MDKELIDRVLKIKAMPPELAPTLLKSTKERILYLYLRREEIRDGPMILILETLTKEPFYRIQDACRALRDSLGFPLGSQTYILLKFHSIMEASRKGL